ncbi:LytR family transcriptional regulator, partial [Streptomyces sp. NPDC127091]
MDAQGRERGNDMDPADQWVLNPDTGDYELRLNDSAPQPSIPSPRRPRPTVVGVGNCDVEPHGRREPPGSAATNRREHDPATATQAG